MKYYAVKKGRVTGVYRTWADAEKQVKGYSGAEYQAFDQITQAAHYANMTDQTQGDSLTDALKKIQKHSQAQTRHAKTKAVANPAATSYFATVYTDGGSRNTGVYQGGHVKKTDKAAWAYLIEFKDQEVHGSGGEFGATNNKMEQLALINALKKLIELKVNQKPLLFVLDSQYVLNAINKHWLESWRQRGWRRSKGDLKNAAQWQQLAKLLPYFTHAQFTWTKGHANNRGNEFVDHELNRYMDRMS